ncbi:hypothetical protein BD310DRAFT_910999 [Dichomitus squalens]|uniref:Uncharacterized protein n=1 Tax=Dichomitus squalens TaxID=114155 RepID=A0A4V2K9U4_9APHY|nr:hypothetical protein BD310DRAFT_910999 [Dichomitus squalens]
MYRGADRDQHICPTPAAEKSGIRPRPSRYGGNHVDRDLDIVRTCGLFFLVTRPGQESRRPRCVLPQEGPTSFCRIESINDY